MVRGINGQGIGVSVGCEGHLHVDADGPGRISQAEGHAPGGTEKIDGPKSMADLRPPNRASAKKRLHPRDIRVG
jgi:hypothetical protein